MVGDSDKSDVRFYVSPFLVSFDLNFLWEKISLDSPLLPAYTRK